MYSMLLQCTGQVYFMQTELPSMIAVSEKNYQLNNFFMVKATQVIYIMVNQ